MSDVKITKPVSIVFSPQGIAYVLDTLAKRPYNEVTGLINDIFGQIKAQEAPPSPPQGDNDGKT